MKLFLSGLVVLLVLVFVALLFSGLLFLCGVGWTWWMSRGKESTNSALKEEQEGRRVGPWAIKEVEA